MKVEVLQHLPDPGSRLIRRYGLYSSRSRGTWSGKPHLARLAPEGWQKDHPEQPAPASQEDTPDQSVSLNESRSAWARLLAKVTYAAGGPRFMSEHGVACIHNRPDEHFRKLRLGLELEG